jgi:hypothetical protein
MRKEKDIIPTAIAAAFKRLIWAPAILNIPAQTRAMIPPIIRDFTVLKTITIITINIDSNPENKTFIALTNSFP